MEYRAKSITALRKVCLISALLLPSLLMCTGISLARVTRVSGSVRHSTTRVKHVAATPGGPVTIQPVPRPPRTVRGGSVAIYSTSYGSTLDIGLEVTKLTPGYKVITVQGTKYYYHSGVFYLPSTSGYMIVSAPFGAIVTRRPPGYTNIRVGSEIYYYQNGAYYAKSGGRYMVVYPPGGTILTQLPAGYAIVYIDGIRHYEYGGIYYRPYFHGGRLVYGVVGLQ